MGRFREDPGHSGTVGKPTYIIYTFRVRVSVRVKVRVLRAMVRVSASVRLRCRL